MRVKARWHLLETPVRVGVRAMRVRTVRVRRVQAWAHVWVYVSR